jgi:hypothetical protein
LAPFLLLVLLDHGVMPVVVLSLGAGILSRRIAPPMSSWDSQQGNSTRDKHPAGYDPKGSALDMPERNVTDIHGCEVRGGGCKPQEYTKKTEDRS